MYDPRYTDDLFRPQRWDDYYRMDALRRQAESDAQQREIRALQEAEQRRLMDQARLEEERRKRMEEERRKRMAAGQEQGSWKDVDWGGLLGQFGGMMGGGQQQAPAQAPPAPSIPIPRAQISTRPMEAVWEGFEQPILARMLGLGGQQ